MKYAKFLLIAIGVVVVALIPACSSALTGSPFLSSAINNAQRLEQVIPRLEQLQVRQFRNQDWCKNFFYARGKFSSAPNNGNCNQSKDKSGLFTPQAEQKFHEAEHALSDSGLKVRMVLAEFNEQDRIRYAEFHLDCFFCRTRYVYAPQYKRLPEDIPNELEYEAIDENWYLVQEDWN
jgi:hypothetical protein